MKDESRAVLLANRFAPALVESLRERYVVLGPMGKPLPEAVASRSIAAWNRPAVPRDAPIEPLMSNVETIIP